MAENSKVISSRSNAHFKNLLELLQTPGIKKSGQFLLSGERLVREAWDHQPHLFQGVVLPASLIELSNKFDGLRSTVLTAELFQELDVLKTKKPILLGQIPQIPISDLSKAPTAPQLCLALGDPANVGAALRCAEAFGISEIVLLKECAHPFHPKALKASSGSSLRLKFMRGPSIQELASNDSLVALDMVGESLSKYRWPLNFRLLVGQEGLGIPEQLECRRVKIPIASSVESLNAAVAVGISLFHWQSHSKT